MKNAICYLVSFTLLTISGVVQAETLLIRNAKVYTLTERGTLDRAAVLIRDGRIAAVEDEVPGNFRGRTIDASGKSLTPGLVNAWTHLGIEEISAVAHTSDAATEDVLFGPSFRVAPAINPASTIIPHNRLNGLTHAIVVPDSAHQLFAGQAAVIRLADESTMLVDDSIAMFASYDSRGSELSGGSRAASHARLRLSLDDALEYRQNRQKIRSGNWREFFLPLHDLEALVPVATGEQQLVISVHRASDIRKLLTLKKRYGLKLVIAGASEAWMLAGDIAAAGIPVLMDPMANLPRDFDQLAAHLDAAAILHKAGVRLLFTGVAWRNTHSAYLVRQAAGNAAANGLPVEEAIRAMTLNPAQVFGFAEHYGTIEKGKVADLVIWDGHPLELLTRADQVIIGGEPVPMVSRATRLRDRYLDLDTAYPPAYRK